MSAEPIEIRSTQPEQAEHTGCACGHEDVGEIVLDTRQIPHAIRHATIFGALDSLAPGISLDIVANHNPLPLVAQLKQKHPGDFEISYVEDGPEVWKLRFTRTLRFSRH